MESLKKFENSSYMIENEVFYNQINEISKKYGLEHPNELDIIDKEDCVENDDYGNKISIFEEILRQISLVSKGK